MTQQLIPPETFARVAHSTMEWARTVARQLDAVERQHEQARLAAAEVLHGRVQPLEQVKGETTFVLAGCHLIRLSLDTRETDVLRRYVAWSVQSASVREHSAALRSALDVASARTRKGFLRRHRSEDEVSDVDRLRELQDWAQKTGYGQALAALAEHGPLPDAKHEASVVMQAAALSLEVPEPRGDVPTLSGDEVATLLGVLNRGANVLDTRERLAQEVRRTFGAVRDRMVSRRLKELPVSTIKDASKGQLRVTAALEAAGINSVGDVLKHGNTINRRPGIGHATATQVLATARSLERTVRDDLRLRIDLDENDTLLTTLVATLQVLLDFEERVEKHREALDELVQLLTPLRKVPPGDGDVTLLHRHSPRRGADLTCHLIERAAWVRESGLDSLLNDAGAVESRGVHAWEDFKRRAAEYYGLLGELVGISVDVEAAQGHLPTEVVETVHRQDLDSSRLKASLRGYQAFGARYALVQRKVIIGDEMGLGKTVQSLAVMAHLAANGAQHFLVVCPTSVLVNWTKEIRKHSYLEPVRVHGPDREQEWRRWRSRGGVAVTSYQTLLRLPDGDVTPDLLVVDEAHYVKNPEAKRSAAVAGMVERSGRTMFLTGTPLENRVAEFENLVRYLQPEIAKRLDSVEMVLGAHKFREAVAPVYLRRNSDDVLSELPDLVEKKEWLEFTDNERDAYVNALSEHAFQEMRRVAFTADPSRSSKLERLYQIVEEAHANSHNVVIFSYFLDVLAAVANRLGNRVIGTITGATSADGRQALADALSESDTPGVLLSQIVAGGVGMNLQAASVVILCEPQVKPALENQAVKRAHRMGQVRTVQVHRLLTEDSLDERMLQMLDRKSEIFAAFAAQSDVAAASPDAIDITENDLVKQVLADEQKRYAEKIRACQALKSVARPAAQVEKHGPKPRAALGGLGPVTTVGHPASDPKPNSTPTTKPAPSGSPLPAERRLEVYRPAHKCNSCDGPIGVNGQCGCS